MAPHHRSGVAKAWQHARSTFASGLEAILAASGGIAVAVIILAAFMLAALTAYRIGRCRML